MRSTRGSDPLDYAGRPRPASCSRSVFRSSVIPPSAGSRSRRCSSRWPANPDRDPESRPLRRALLLGLATGVVYFTGTLYWITRVMAVYGGLQHGSPCSSTRRCRLPRALSGRVRGRDAAHRSGVRRPRADGGSAGLGRDRARAHVHLHGISVGAARLQPGDGAADRAAREPVRRLRRVGARRGGQFGAGAGRAWSRQNGT